MIDFGKNVQQAIAAPRWRSGVMPIGTTRAQQDLIHFQRGVDGYDQRSVTEVVMLENRFPRDVPFLLDILGHRTIVEGAWEDDMGHAQAIRIDPVTHVFEGGADPRCDGLALGW
jgi:gamma-glutamyltranspeptidase/glutathione hydrolase